MIKRQYRGKSGKTPRITPTKAAYVAGFLDGDGSISAKLTPTKTGKYGYRVRLMINFTQHTRNRAVLSHIQEILGGGRKIADYKSKNLSEYVVQERKQVERVLKHIKPFLSLKRKQAEIALKILDIFRVEKRRKRSILNQNQFLEIVRLADEIRKLNAMTGMKSKHKASKVIEEMKKRGFLP